VALVAAVAVTLRPGPATIARPATGP
jgi:hypothetical protein